MSKQVLFTDAHGKPRERHEADHDAPQARPENPTCDVCNRTFDKRNSPLPEGGYCLRCRTIA